MARRMTQKAVDRTRFAQGTIVGWFEGMTERSGRVLINIPGTQWNVGHCVVRDSNGKQTTVRADLLFVKRTGD